jgi:tetrahydromethanopterin S-methyltransferase subunit G
MTDEAKIDLLIKHDKNIDLMASSIEHLAISVGGTNTKLDKVIEAMNTQNVLMEKFSNLESNLNESFGRVYTRIKTIEDTHVGNGCGSVILVGEKIKVANSRIDDIERAIKFVIGTIATVIIVSIMGMIIIKG